jgi:hypothetical protein
MMFIVELVGNRLLSPSVCQLVAFLSFHQPNQAASNLSLVLSLRETGLLFGSLQTVYIMFIGKKGG